MTDPARAAAEEIIQRLNGAGYLYLGIKGREKPASGAVDIVLGALPSTQLGNLNAKEALGAMMFDMMDTITGKDELPEGDNTDKFVSAWLRMRADRDEVKAEADRRIASLTQQLAAKDLDIDDQKQLNRGCIAAQIDTVKQLALAQQQVETMQRELRKAIGGDGTLDLRPSILTSAQRCQEVGNRTRHAVAVADCDHCHLCHAASSIRKLVAAIEAALAPAEGGKDKPC